MLVRLVPEFRLRVFPVEHLEVRNHGTLLEVAFAADHGGELGEASAFGPQRDVR